MTTASVAARIAADAPPASIVAVGRGGRVVDVDAASVAGHAVPDADTAFRIASCTKSFTSATLLSLRDAGLVDFDRPAEHYVPAFAGSARPAGWPPPTVRMLMSMSGGLPTDDPWADRLESTSTADLLALLDGGVRFTHQPGIRYQYSNLGYAVLGAVIDAVAERPFLDVVAAFVGEVGLTATGWTAPDGHPVAIGHHRVDDAWVALAPTAPGAFSSMGGLWSTAADLTAWTHFLGSAFTDAPASGPLSAASRRELQQIQRTMPTPAAPRRPIGPTMGYGFGVIADVGGEHGTVVSHSGGYPGYSAHMRWHPATGTSVVGFENATYSGVIEPVAAHFVDVLPTPALSAPVAWPEALEAAGLAERMLRGDPAAAAALRERFAVNVDLDEPFARRAARWDAVVASVGALAPLVGDAATSGAADVLDVHELDWIVPAERGCVRIELALTPTEPPLVQLIDVVAGG